MNIELYYFEGCPTYKEAAENLRKALDELDIKEDFKMIEVVNPQDAISKKFLGSPSIRINGIDLENKDGAYIFGCRIYTIEGKISGTPTRNHIISRLKSLIT
jgi:hypothetical protein